MEGFRDEFLEDLMRVLADFWSPVFVLFVVFRRNPKMKNCVWTAPAWVDCMCGLPEEHMSLRFFLWFLDFFFIMSPRIDFSMIL